MMFRAIILTLLFSLFSISNSYSQSKEQVYAGIILHIMKYVEWPAYEQKMTIGIVNNPQLVRSLQKAALGKKVHFKNVEVSKLEDVNKMVDSDVLFFSKSALKKISSEIINQSQKKGILIISEAATPSTKGQCINFTQVEGRLKLELYTKAIDDSGFKVSSQLKKIALVKG